MLNSHLETQMKTLVNASLLLEEEGRDALAVYAPPLLTAQAEGSSDDYAQNLGEFHTKLATIANNHDWEKAGNNETECADLLNSFIL